MTMWWWDFSECSNTVNPARLWDQVSQQIGGVHVIWSMTAVLHGRDAIQMLIM